MQNAESKMLPTNPIRLSKKQHQKRIYPAHTNDENYGEKFLVQRGSEKYKRKTICVDKKKKKKL